ncbi:sensor histidine kinase [Magnetococcus sp. PR-3]|uniref:sensor histidine kinase n=1 Tax=Magnetococcus sp. PR-3 TaxID=3120355 RepID=UPI002FCE678A
MSEAEGSQPESTINNALIKHLAHELRTPLNGILGHLQLAQSHTKLPADLKSHLEGIGKSCQNLDWLLTSILDYSQISQHDWQLEQAPLPIARLKQRLQHQLEQRFGSVQERLTLSFDSTLPEYIHCDANRLQHLLYIMCKTLLKHPEIQHVTLTCRNASPTPQTLQWMLDSHPTLNTYDITFSEMEKRYCNHLLKQMGRHEGIDTWPSTPWEWSMTLPTPSTDPESSVKPIEDVLIIEQADGKDAVELACAFQALEIPSHIDRRPPESSKVKQQLLCLPSNNTHLYEAVTDKIFLTYGPAKPEVSFRDTYLGHLFTPIRLGTLRQLLASKTIPIEIEKLAPPAPSTKLDLQTIQLSEQDFRMLTEWVQLGMMNKLIQWAEKHMQTHPQHIAFYHALQQLAMGVDRPGLETLLQALPSTDTSD